MLATVVVVLVFGISVAIVIDLWLSATIDVRRENEAKEEVKRNYPDSESDAPRRTSS